MEWECYEWELCENVLAQAIAAAQSESPVLLTGETGTGHEAVARHIHSHSSRMGGPFASINCAALPDALLARILVGCQEGFDRDAHKTNEGVIGQARGGVLFAYPIEPIGTHSDSVLRRLFQDGEYLPLGVAQPIRADVRVMVATNTGLEKAVDRGEMSPDLYMRLSGLEIRLPPLRDRRGEIIGLAERYVAQRCNFIGRRLELAPSAREAILEHAWPGNLRELHNVLERAVLLSDGNEITANDLATSS